MRVGGNLDITATLRFLADDRSRSAAQSDYSDQLRSKLFRIVRNDDLKNSL